MCQDDTFAQRFAWEPLMKVAKTPSFLVPKEGGVYSVRVKKHGIKDAGLMIRRFLNTNYMKALKEKDRASVELYETMDLPRSDVSQRMYNPDEFGKAKRRLERLQELSLSGEDSCPILYLGCTNNLYRRLDELLWGGHTANHAVWPLLVAKWELDYGWHQSTAYRDDETSLKELYRRQHSGSLPPLMEI